MSVNFRPYGISYDHATRTSTVFDRCFRPIAKLPGRFPRVNHSDAVACGIDEPRCYSGERTFFYNGDNARICDPAVRRRLSELSQACPALATEIGRRIKQATEAAKPVDLIALTFG